MKYTAAVITVSDSCARGEREDVSGRAVREALIAAGFEVVESLIIADEAAQVEASLRKFVDLKIRFVVTTGGTGIGPRDVTPEATLAVCEKLLPGLAELMRLEGRAQAPMAALSRGVCGTCGETLIINLPGSPAGAVASLQIVLPLIPHALELLAGNTRH